VASKGEGHQLPYWLLFKGGSDRRGRRRGEGGGWEREEVEKKGRGRRWRKWGVKERRERRIARIEIISLYPVVLDR